jgi:thioredoxin 1
MKTWLKRNWAGLGFVMLAGAGSLAAYCLFTSNCAFAATRSSKNSLSTIQKQQTNGAQTMSTDIQNAIVHADAKSFRKEVLQSEVPVLVDFYADWCAPCRALGPVLEELAQETPNAKIVKVNVDDSPQLAGQYGVSSIPNLLVFRDGKVTHQQAGLASKQQLKTLLAE